MALIRRVLFKLLKTWWKITVRMRLRMQGIEMGKEIQFYGMPIISMVKGSRIRLGDRVVLCSDSRFTALGVNHPVVLRTLRPDAEIIIGNDCGISGGSICAAIRVELGDECLIGANVSITDTDFHAIKTQGRRHNNNPMEISAKPITIERNVFIGANSIILKGVIIRENSVIGAGSVLTKSIPANQIWAGNPARILNGDALVTMQENVIQ